MHVGQVVSIVTGGASGLGEACVRSIIEAGGKVSIIDFDSKRGEKISEEIGINVCFFKADITDEIQVTSAVHGTIETFGNINTVINCAGIVNPAKVIGKNGPIPLEDFVRVVNVNLVGTMNVLRVAVEKIMLNTPTDDGERGVVINTASVAAFEGQVGQAAYSASKAGVVGMTLPLAREFADYGIRVNTIAPGLFMTPMMASLPEKAKASLAEMMLFPKRLGNPVEFAMLVQQIIENPMLNGETIRLDGGLRMKKQ